MVTIIGGQAPGLHCGMCLVPMWPLSCRCVDYHAALSGNGRRGLLKRDAVFTMLTEGTALTMLILAGELAPSSGGRSDVKEILIVPRTFTAYSHWQSTADISFPI